MGAQKITYLKIHMSLKRKFLNSMLIGSSILAASTAHADSNENKMEKCFGVVKAGKNDCADLKNTHSCAGEAKVNGNKEEWILLPKGVCERLVNGKKA
jgi:uncharacterized membrane protein